ncbi:MAG: hypothetical protein HDS77_08320 [Bacteroidales bacterium]|nr:hypothetical protein [Bacteroidales bacterium]
MENCIETEILGGAPESLKPADEAASQTTDEPVGEEAPNESGDETGGGDASETEAGGETGGEVADAPETNPTPTDGAISPEEVERLIAEAEARGYERGRNAGIEAWINESRRIALPHSREKPDCESEIMILNNMRRSVWDE